MPEGKRKYGFTYKYSNPQPEVQRFDSGINDIINATRQQNFTSPFINQPEKVQIPDTKMVTDAPRKREADSVTQGILKGLTSPILGVSQELGSAGDEFRQGKIGSGIADLLKGTLHTAMTPITMPIGAVSEGLKGTGQIGKDVAKGLEQTMNLPFDVIKQGSELVKQGFDAVGLDISDSETSKKFNELTQEVGGLLLMGKGIRDAKKYVEAKVPEIKQINDVKQTINAGDVGIDKLDLKPEINPENRTSIKNRMMNQDRIDRGLEPLPKPETRKQAPILEDVKQKIDSGELDPNKLAKEIIDNPRILNDADVAALQINAVKLKNERTRLADEIAKETDPIKKAELNAQSLLIDEQYNINNIASKQTGTDTARALAMRKIEQRDDYSIAPLIQRARIANKDKAVPEDVRAKLEDYSKRITEADAKVKEYEAQLQNLRVEKELQDKLLSERRKGRISKKEKLDEEYQSLIKEFASTMQLNALVDPKQVQLMVKMGLNRIQKGGLTVEQIVDDIYNNTKQFIKELTKEDVRNALSDSGRFAKLTKEELKKRIAEIKRAEGSDQARLQKAYKTRLENRRKEYERMLETGDYTKKPRRKTEMTPELSKLKDEVEVLKQHADREIRLIELKNRTSHEKLRDTAIDIANIPRTVMASIDLSAPLRQGIIFSAAHPKIAFGEGGAFREMFRYFQSDKAIRELQRTIEDSPNAPLYIKSKLYLANEKTNIGRLSGREEAFLSTLPERVPILGKGIKASNRAYAGFLDKMRMDVFDFYSEQFKKSGVTFESNPKAYKDLAKFINSATGRGTLGGFERSATALSGFLFSPRLIASRLQLINPSYYWKLDPAVRKLAMKDMVKFLGAGMTILSLAKLAGAEVESDPRSADFGKIKVGNTRLDVWGGFQQYAVFGARLITGEQKIGQGRISKLNSNVFPFTTRADLTTKFIRNKFSPAFGLIWDWASGKDVVGQKFDLTAKAFDLITPLAMKDLYDAYQEENIDGLLLSLPTVFGVGVQTYKQKRKPVNF